MDLLLISGVPPYPLHSEDRTTIYYLGRELSKQHLLDLLFFYHQPEDFAEIPRYEHFFRTIHPIPSPQFTLKDLQHRLKNLHFPDRAEAAWSPEMWQMIETRLDERKYDLVQLIGDINIYEYYPLVKGLPHVVITPHLRSLQLKRQIEHTPKRRQKRQLQQELDIVQAYENWMYNNFSDVIVTTPTQMNSLRENTLAQISMLPMGVDMDYFVPTGHEPRLPTLLYIADFAEPIADKAAVRLCERIFPAVQRVFPQLTLLLVGANPSDKLRNYATENIIITGRVPDLRPYFELTTLFVSPLEHEMGFQQHILNALVMMTPVVATPRSVEGLHLSPDEEIIIAETDTEIAEKIILLLKDKQKRLQLQLNGRNRIHKTYAWDQIANRYLTIHSLFPGQL